MRYHADAAPPVFLEFLDLAPPDGTAPASVVHMFSQSRIGVWDWQHNEFRVRLLTVLPSLEFIPTTALPGPLLSPAREL